MLYSEDMAHRACDFFDAYNVVAALLGISTHKDAMVESKEGTKFRGWLECGRWRLFRENISTLLLEKPLA